MLFQYKCQTSIIENNKKISTCEIYYFACINFLIIFLISGIYLKIMYKVFNLEDNYRLKTANQFCIGLFFISILSFLISVQIFKMFFHISIFSNASLLFFTISSSALFLLSSIYLINFIIGNINIKLIKEGNNKKTELKLMNKDNIKFIMQNILVLLFINIFIIFSILSIIIFTHKIFPVSLFLGLSILYSGTFYAYLLGLIQSNKKIRLFTFYLFYVSKNENFKKLIEPKSLDEKEKIANDNLKNYLKILFMLSSNITLLIFLHLSYKKLCKNKNSF